MVEKNHFSESFNNLFAVNWWRRQIKETNHNIKTGKDKDENSDKQIKETNHNIKTGKDKDENSDKFLEQQKW